MTKKILTGLGLIALSLIFNAAIATDAQAALGDSLETSNRYSTRSFLSRTATDEPGSASRRLKNHGNARVCARNHSRSRPKKVT